MTNDDIAKLLKKVAIAYLLLGENRFRIIAYERAMDAVVSSPIELADLWREGRLADISGIGEGIASYLDELFRSGKVKHFEEILSQIPPAVFPLLDISGIGPKKAYKLVTELKLKNPVTVVKDLLGFAESGRIAKMAGFGERSQKDIIGAIKRFQSGQTKDHRMSLPIALAIASHVTDHLKSDKNVLDVQYLGSLRRMKETIGDIDIAVASRNSEEVIDWFIRYPYIKETLEKGQTGASVILNNGKQVDLRVILPEKFGSMLQYFTGSKNHNIKLREYALKMGLSLSEYGTRAINMSTNYNSKIIEYPTEKKLYKALDLHWIPPEIREDTGEIEAAKNNILPKLVEPDDIKGDLHIHSNYNLESSHDLGASSLEDILIKANELGYEYIGISDHNPSVSNHSEDQIISIMKRRKHHYEQIIQSIKSVRVKIFIMLEIDIQPDGQLALPTEAFEYIDAAIASVHSSFQMDKEQMTKRIQKGLSHRKVKILGHPTGRLIGKREGYDLNWNEILAFCRENNKALEINSYPDRLDLSDIMVREAINNRVKLVINTDSHMVDQLDLIKYGVSVGRRGWAIKDDIINSMSYNDVRSWLCNL